MSEENTSTALATTDREQSWSLQHTEWGAELTTFGEALAFAKLIAESDLVPSEYRRKPANCIVAMTMGREIGLKPLQSLQGICVINGRPCVWGDAIGGIIKNHPLYEWTHEEWDEQTKTATCTMKRKGEPERTQSFGEADAKAAGLMGKDTYRQHLRRMCERRARARCAADVFPDALKGVGVVEEAGDVVEAEFTVVPVAEERLSRAQPVKAPEAEPASEAIDAEAGTVVKEKPEMDRLEKLRARYEELSGKPAHPRMGIPRLIAEIEILEKSAPAQPEGKAKPPEPAPAPAPEPEVMKDAGGDDWMVKDVTDPEPDPPLTQKEFRALINEAYHAKVIGKEDGHPLDHDYAAADDDGKRALEAHLRGKIAKIADRT